MKVVRELTYIGPAEALLHGLRHRAVKISRPLGADVVCYERVTVVEVSPDEMVFAPPVVSDDDLARAREIEKAHHG